MNFIVEKVMEECVGIICGSFPDEANALLRLLPRKMKGVTIPRDKQISSMEKSRIMDCFFQKKNLPVLREALTFPQFTALVDREFFEGLGADTLDHGRFLAALEAYGAFLDSEDFAISIMKDLHRAAGADALPDKDTLVQSFRKYVLHRHAQIYLYALNQGDDFVKGFFGNDFEAFRHFKKEIDSFLSVTEAAFKDLSSKLDAVLKTMAAREEEEAAQEEKLRLAERDKEIKSLKGQLADLKNQLHAHEVKLAHAQEDRAAALGAEKLALEAKTQAESKYDEAARQFAEEKQQAAREHGQQLWEVQKQNQKMKPELDRLKREYRQLQDNHETLLSRSTSFQQLETAYENLSSQSEKEAVQSQIEITGLRQIGEEYRRENQELTESVEKFRNLYLHARGQIGKQDLQILELNQEISQRNKEIEELLDYKRAALTHELEMLSRKEAELKEDSVKRANFLNHLELKTSLAKKKLEASRLHLESEDDRQSGQREKLKQYDGQEITVRMTYIRDGIRKLGDTEYVITSLFRNVVKTDTEEVLTSHIWLDKDDVVDSWELNPQDLVECTGVVTFYNKIGNRGMMSSRDTKLIEDYRLNHVSYFAKVEPDHQEHYA